MYLDPKEFQGFLLGNVLKYLLRLGRKDEAGKEVDKAFQYLLWLRQAVNGERNEAVGGGDYEYGRYWSQKAHCQYSEKSV